MKHCQPTQRAWVTALMSLTLKLASASVATASLTYCAAQGGQPVQQRISTAHAVRHGTAEGASLPWTGWYAVISSSSPGPPSPQPAGA